MYICIYVYIRTCMYVKEKEKLKWSAKWPANWVKLVVTRPLLPTLLLGIS